MGDWKHAPLYCGARLAGMKKAVATAGSSSRSCSAPSVVLKGRMVWGREGYVGVGARATAAAARILA